MKGFQYSPSSIEVYTSAIQNNSKCYIDNVDTTFSNLELSEKLKIPITINDKEYSNSYVSSPYTALIPYCKEELQKVDSRILKSLISLLIFSFDAVLRGAKINQVVQLNNWMLSTNLFPKSLTKDDILKSKELMLELKPEHLLMYRSLNHHNNLELIDSFERSGFSMLPTRQVYIFDKSVNDYSKSHNYKIDKKLIEKTNYRYVYGDAITKDDYPRIVELYNMLYIKKYSNHNPKFTTKYIELIAKHPNFELGGFRNEDGILDAVGGRFEMDGIVTLPIVGYDTSKSQKLGLYRLVMISTLIYAESNDLVFNASSGASGFKRLRGAVPFIEFAAINYSHLPFYRRALWKLLTVILDRVFIPIMKRYEL
jgi:hypothetical protein